MEALSSKAVHKYNILAVDDQVSILEALDALLEDFSEYNLLMADRAEDAIALAERNRIDLILLDLIMPDVRGDELLTGLQQCCRNILILSALSQRGALFHMMKTRVQGYVTKPFDVDDLTAKIAAALENGPPHDVQLKSNPSLSLALKQWRLPLN